MEVQRKLSAGETISGTKEDIVIAADIKSAEERNTEFVPNGPNNNMMPDPFL
jgi:hypothetical protein